MTPFQVYRANIGSSAGAFTDTPPMNTPPNNGSVVESIDLSYSASGQTYNKICLVFAPVSGACTVAFGIDLWCKFKDPGSSLNDYWVKIDDEPNVQANHLYTFENLYSGEYKVVISSALPIPQDDFYNVHESHFGYRIGNIK